MFKATTGKLSEIKDVIEFSSNYQVAFDKVTSLIFKTSPYTRRSIEAFFQATVLVQLSNEFEGHYRGIYKD